MRSKSTPLRPLKTVKFHSNQASFGLSTIDENESSDSTTTESVTIDEISTWDGRFDLVNFFNFIFALLDDLGS